MKVRSPLDERPKGRAFLHLRTLLVGLIVAPALMASGSAAPEVNAAPSGEPVLQLEVGPNPDCFAIVQVLCMHHHPPPQNDTWLCYVYNRPVLGDHIIDGCTHT